MLTPPAALLALLFTHGEPMPKKDAAKILGAKPEDLKKAVDVLHESLTQTGLSVIETDEDLELRTAPEAAEIVKKLRESELSKDLGKAGLETLAAIAYRAGSTRGEIDWIRGVNSSTSLRTLLIRGLIEGNEDPADKRRIRYSITTEALAHLGVSKIENLPRFEELSKEAEQVVAENLAAAVSEAGSEPAS
ncbi:MAG TPA: SMC-Scp complex subunit ScpB [Candidatus Paceibacterota bacterium]|nr:SMC-Scp complex subunit ScpB [Candidatus Paceibacterota bacterium]